MADIEPLEHRLAGVLSELEDAEVELTNKEHKLAKELQAVQGELERIHTVKAAILGKPKPARVGATEQTRVNRAKVEQWISDLNNGQQFSARDLATGVGLDLRGVGPILGGFVRRGAILEAEGKTDTGHKLYTRA